MHIAHAIGTTNGSRINVSAHSVSAVAAKSSSAR
jgi:hypothetical protein